MSLFDAAYLACQNAYGLGFMYAINPSSLFQTTISNVFFSSTCTMALPINCLCLKCVTPNTLTSQGHKHPLSFYLEYEEHCNACGYKIDQASIQP